MRAHISAGWFIGVPKLVFHKNAVQAVIAFTPPTCLYHTPRSISDDLPDTNAIVFETQSLVFTYTHRTGSGCGVVTGAFSGTLGGGFTGSRVGNTGSSRGMTVYLLIGCPICAIADLPCASVPPRTDLRQPGRCRNGSVNKEGAQLVLSPSLNERKCQPVKASVERLFMNYGATVVCVPSTSLAF
jgi:hypothetical protein